MDRLASAAAVPPATTAAAACRSAASSRRPTAWVRVRTLSWFAGEEGSKASSIRAASRNEVRAPSSACTRSSSGVQRAVNSVPTGESVTAAVGANGRQRQTRNRGASTSTVPNRDCSRRPRRSLRGCGTRHCGQIRWHATYSATWLCTMITCSLARTAFASTSARPRSARVPSTTGRSIVTSSVVSTSPWPVLASSRTVHRITPALVVRPQPGRLPRDRQAACPRFLTLPSPTISGPPRRACAT